jgi:uncharacterized protein (DUF4415 family)
MRKLASAAEGGVSTCCEDDNEKNTLKTLPRLSKADRARLKALAARPDSEIDTSDIPEMTNEQWKHARRGHFYRPRKRQITARVDWLKSQGKGYQSRINAILRREMLTSVKSIR